MLAWCALAAAVLPSPAPGASPADLPRLRTLAVTLVRLDLKRHVLTVALSGPSAREYDLEVDGRTRLVREGRTLAFEDLPMGEPALVVLSDDEHGGHHAVVVKVGRRGDAAPRPVP